MHELGHLLGFEHGGPDKVNCKPNYRSVMSYSRQFAGSPIRIATGLLAISGPLILPAQDHQDRFLNESRPLNKGNRSGPTRAAVRYLRLSPRWTGSRWARAWSHRLRQCGGDQLEPKHECVSFQTDCHQGTSIRARDHRL